MTKEQEVYFRPDAQVEPLLCGWSAWTHLISPTQYALNVTYRHLPLLQSFLNTPSVHIAASKDPSLFGGPFVDLEEGSIESVRELLKRTQVTCDKQITFGKQWRTLNALLHDGATGYCLNEFYTALPSSLEGLVEFVYNADNRPEVRIREELLYYEELNAAEEEVLITLEDEKNRKFFLSTPRLETSDSVIVKINFGDEGLDALFEMRHKLGSFEAVSNLLGIVAEKKDLFRTFFSPNKLTRENRLWQSDGIRVRYFGHACVLIQSNETSILIDPLFAWNTQHNDGRLTFADLPDWIDVVVISHNHQDHFNPESLIQLRRRIGKIIVPDNNAGSVADPSMKLALRKLGFRNIDVVRPFDETGVQGGSIMSLPFAGEHCDLDIHSKQAIFVRLNGKKLLFFVDSDGWDPSLYRRIANQIGTSVDLIFLGMECHGAPLTWLYGPLLTKSISRRNDESRRLSAANAERAWAILQHISSPRVFVYAMGQEPWLRYIMGLQYAPESVQLKEVAKFLDQCNTNGITARKLEGSCDIFV